MQGQVERRRGRRQFTIDQPFNGNEGWIAWYCHYIEGKFYPLVGQRNSLTTFIYAIPKQIEIARNYLFLLTEDTYLYIFDTSTLSLIHNIDGIKKIGLIEINGNPHLVVLRTSGQLQSTPIPFSGFNQWIQNVSLSNIDFSIYQNRVFLLREESGKKVIYFSRSFFPDIPRIFLYEQNTSRNDFFTFAPNFFLVPQSNSYILFKNFLITDRAVYVIKERSYGGVLQFYPEFSFNLPDSINVFKIQGNKNGIFFGSGNSKAWDWTGKEYNFSVRKFLSYDAFPVIQNNYYSSIIDENFRIDFHNEDFLVKIGENFCWISPVKTTPDYYRIKIFKINENRNQVLDGKVIFFTSFNDAIHYKYLKKIAIKEFKELYKIPSNPSFVPVAPFPYGLTNSLTEEEITQQKKEWIQVRSSGIKFQIEVSIREGGILPIIEAEFDGGR
jgi:hypothetical protein